MLKLFEYTSIFLKQHGFHMKNCSALEKYIFMLHFFLCDMLLDIIISISLLYLNMDAQCSWLYNVLEHSCIPTLICSAFYICFLNCVCLHPCNIVEVGLKMIILMCKTCVMLEKNTCSCSFFLFFLNCVYRYMLF